MHIKVKNYTDLEILHRIKQLPDFKGFPKGYFIVGIRSNEDTYDTYDDKFYIYMNEGLHMSNNHKSCVFIDVLTGTTNPGGGILKGGFLKYNKKGAAILKSNCCHYNIWRPANTTSRGYELKQVNDVKIYRDADQDELSEESGKLYTGLFGINFHTNTFKWYNSVINWFIGTWSAGCQVTNNRKKFIKYMHIFLFRYHSGDQRRISYFLLREF